MNRFLEMEQRLKAKTEGKNRGARRRTSGALSQFARPFAATDRALVVLIDNGGVDLGIPELVDKLIAATPLASLLPAELRQRMIDYLRDQLRSATDQLLESAELALNRYNAAKPDLFAEVSMLRDGSASYQDLKSKLFTLSRAGKIVDLLVLTHGSEDNIYLSTASSIDGDKIRAMRNENGRPLPLRSVYMMNCVGASLNQAWLDAGAKASAGTIRNNYLPEPTTYFFWQSWKEGQNFESAVLSAYRRTVGLLNKLVRSFVATLPIPGASLLADQIDIEQLGFVQDSAPVVQGQRTVTINSDDLTFTQSISSSLASTVLPVDRLRGLAYAQNPIILEAVGLGLAAIGLVQSQVNASQGTFTLTYQQAQRLLTNEARNRMPGAQRPKSSYAQVVLTLPQMRAGTASAQLTVRWEGNAYGEISTPVIRRELANSTEWSHSEANINIIKVDRIPTPNTDPRAWPIVYVYNGTYNPLGNGYYEFNGEFAIDAFGGIKFAEHQVVSRSLLDATIMMTPEQAVARGPDVMATVPAIPDDQLAFLRNTLP